MNDWLMSGKKCNLIKDKKQWGKWKEYNCCLNYVVALCNRKSIR